MNRTGVRGYDTAEAWLQGARAKLKNERSLYETGVRLIRDSPTEISVAIQYYRQSQYTRLVTYRSDGTTVLHPSWKYQSVRRIISEYVPNLTIVYRKGQLVLSIPSDGKTPSKYQKCRSCSGVGSHAKQCYGPNTCGDQSCEKTREREILQKLYWQIEWTDPQKQTVRAQMDALQHTHGTCKHGKNNAHTAYDDRYDCYRCSGQGQADYGNKQRGRVWDNRTAIGIDANGKYVEV